MHEAHLLLKLALNLVLQHVCGRLGAVRHSGGDRVLDQVVNLLGDLSVLVVRRADTAAAPDGGLNGSDDSLQQVSDGLLGFESCRWWQERVGR